MNAPKDPRSLVGLLECKDDTAAVLGAPHKLVEAQMGNDILETPIDK